MLPSVAMLLAVALGAPVHRPALMRHPSSPRVEAIATPLDEAAIFAVLDRTRGRASHRQVLMTWALVELENGRGRAIFGNNLGNVGPTTRQAPRFRLRDGGFYESFPTPHAGATKLWAVLGRCSAAMASADAGDGLGTARALRRCGYHRTDPARYGSALRSLYREAVTRWPVQVSPVRRHRARPTLYARHEESNR